MASWSTFSSSAESRPSLEQMARLRAAQSRNSPPANVLPTSFPLAVALARNDAVALTILGAHVYPNGLSLSFITILRRRSGNQHLGRHFNRLLGHLGEPDADPDKILRLGLRYPDGRVWTNLDQPDMHAALQGDIDENAPRLIPRSGSGDDRRYEQQTYLTPLPPDGPLDVFCAWPEYDIPETAVTVDLTGLAAAAAQAVELWPEGDEPYDQMRPQRLRLGEQGDSFFPPILGREGDDK